LRDLSISYALNRQAGVPFSFEFDPVEAGIFFVQNGRYRVFEPVTFEAVFAWLKNHGKSPIDELTRQILVAIKHQKNSICGIWFEALLGHLIAGNIWRIIFIYTLKYHLSDQTEQTFSNWSFLKATSAKAEFSWLETAAKFTFATSTKVLFPELDRFLSELQSGKENSKETVQSRGRPIKSLGAYAKRNMNTPWFRELIDSLFPYLKHATTKDIVTMLFTSTNEERIAAADFLTLICRKTGVLVHPIDKLGADLIGFVPTKENKVWLP